MSKYAPLTDYLRSRPQKESIHTLSLSEIERIIQNNLPPTAKKHRPWWANTESNSHSQAQGWLNAGWKVTKVDLNEKRVTFARLNGVVKTSRSSRNRYDNLRLFFTNAPAQQEQIALTFKEMSALLGGKLPDTALHDRPWWANTKSNRQGTAWMTAGWRVEKVFLKAEVVTFRRKGDNPLHSIPRYVKGLIEGSTHLGRPVLHMLVSWIRFCKRVGWYFEATVLYERAGLDIDSLDENERAELEEDYTVCKRELSRCKDVLISMNKGK